MRFYYCEGKYFGNKESAERHAREEAKESYGAIVVTVADVATDKANILRILNNEGGDTVFGAQAYIAKGRKKRED